jgi:hypothetical protein
MGFGCTVATLSEQHRRKRALATCDAHRNGCEWFFVRGQARSRLDSHELATATRFPIREKLDRVADVIVHA